MARSNLRLRAQPASAHERLLLGFGMHEVVLSRGAHQLGRRLRSAAGRIHFQVVVQLDDFGMFEERGRLPRELHHQYRADREVRGKHHARLACRGFALQPPHEVVGVSRRSNDHAHAPGQRGFGKAGSPGRVREVYDDVRLEFLQRGSRIVEQGQALEGADLRQTIDITNWRHARLGEDGGCHLSAHAARTRNKHPDICHRPHCTTAGQALRGS